MGSRQFLIARPVAAPLYDAADEIAAGAAAGPLARAEAALRESEERYRSLFANMTEGFALGEAICDADGQSRDFRFVEMNAAFERQSGLRRDVTQGRPIREVLPHLEQSWIDIYCDVALGAPARRFESYNRDLDRHFSVYCFSPREGQFAILFTDITAQKRIEDALRESEERFRDVANHMSQLAWTADETGAIFWYNARWFEYTGTTLAEMQGWGWQSVHHPDYLAQVLERFRQAIADGQPWEDTFPLRSRTGEYRWFLSRAVPIRDEQGRVRRWFGTNTDVTEQRRAEAALQAAHDTFRHLVEQSPFGVYVVDADFRLLQVSAGAQKVFENVRPLLGRDFAEVLRTIWAEPFASQAIARFRHTLDTGQPYRSPSTIEVRQDIPAVESYDWKIERLVLPDGRYGVVCHFYDLSERQRYEAALHAKTQQLESLFTNAPIGLAFFDRDHRYVEVNEELAEMNGIPAADHLGRRIEDLLPVNAATVTPIVDRVFQTGEAVQSLEVGGETPREPGVPRHWLAGLYPVRDPEGRVVMVGAWVIEITARKRVEQELQEADRRKTEFLAMLSHELRNPLAPIRTGIHLLERADPASEAARRAREAIRRQSDHLTRLVDDLLDVTRISRGKIELRRERLDLVEVARRTLDDFRQTSEQAGLALELDLPERPVWIDGDGTRLAQVIGNLLQNALKFTPEGGRVTVGVSTGDRQARLAVRDTGIGMDPQQLERMFEPFAQAENGLARSRGGLGLGLSLVKGLVELHGGSVGAGSDGPGHGAEFTFTVPLAGEPEAATAPDAREHAGRLVVVVEDNRDAALVLADMLEMHGHRVHIAHDGRTGLALAREVRPDVVLCDLGLPDVDGFEVARRVRADDSLKDVRLIALTGYAQPEDQRLTAEAGFDIHLAKPPDPDALLDAIASR